MGTIKLFCVPFAGGSAMTYTKWKKYLDSSIELVPVELRGRGKRYSEPFYNSFEDAVGDVFDAIEKQMGNGEYVIFGHSMGSLLVYEAVHKIRAAKYKEPMHIFFSGRYPPHVNKNEKILHLLPDEEFKEEIFKYGGTPKELLENKELLDIFVPIMRADYRILETHCPVIKDYKYDFGISVLNGTQDEEVTRDDYEEWKRYTAKECNIYEFDGGHFFINDKTKEVTDILNTTLTNRVQDDRDRILDIICY